MKYKAKLAIRHNQKEYAPGDEIELTEKAAAPLIKIDAIEDIKKGKKNDEPPKK